MELFRQGVINVQRIADVHREWLEPSLDGFEDYTAWRLFNAVTTALEGRVDERPASTQQLHAVIDSVCEEVRA
jgi:hypothetical protein